MTKKEMATEVVFRILNHEPSVSYENTSKVLNYEEHIMMVEELLIKVTSDTENKRWATADLKGPVTLTET